MIHLILKALIVASPFVTVLFSPAVADEARPRLLVLTDIGGDPDDQQSMVRLMLYANEFEIEGLIASASGTPGELKEAVTKPQLIREIVDAYGQVRDSDPDATCPIRQHHQAGRGRRIARPPGTDRHGPTSADDLSKNHRHSKLNPARRDAHAGVQPLGC